MFLAYELRILDNYLTPDLKIRYLENILNKIYFF
jgi:hypothetical protein